VTAANPIEQTIRLFIAIELPPDALAWCTEAIERARRELGTSAAALRWVRPEGIHLTLKFLGEVPTSTTAALIGGLSQGVPGMPEFELAIGRAGVFPNQRQPRVLWLGLLGDLAATKAAQERVESAIVPLGFPPEARQFQPHLTLGRVRENARPEQLAAIGRLPSTWPTTVSPPFRVTSISLIQSHLGPGGARYTPLARIDFGNR
jgi:2'-5' RNA ligase